MGLARLRPLETRISLPRKLQAQVRGCVGCLPPDCACSLPPICLLAPHPCSAQSESHRQAPSSVDSSDSCPHLQHYPLQPGEISDSIF